MGAIPQFAEMHCPSVARSVPPSARCRELDPIRVVQVEPLPSALQINGALLLASKIPESADLEA